MVIGIEPSVTHPIFGIDILPKGIQTIHVAMMEVEQWIKGCDGELSFTENVIYIGIAHLPFRCMTGDTKTSLDQTQSAVLVGRTMSPIPPISK